MERRGKTGCRIADAKEMGRGQKGEVKARVETGMDGKGTEMEWRSDRAEMGRRQRVNGDGMEKEQSRDGRRRRVSGDEMEKGWGIDGEEMERER